MFHLNLVNLEKSELKKVFVLYKVIWIMNRYVVQNAAKYLFSVYRKKTYRKKLTEKIINHFLRKFFTLTNKLNNKN